MYGKLSNNQTSFYEEQMHAKSKGLYYRLGNSILEELRQSEHQKEQVKLATFIKKQKLQTKRQFKAYFKSRAISTKAT